MCSNPRRVARTKSYSYCCIVNHTAATCLLIQPFRRILNRTRSVFARRGCRVPASCTAVVANTDATTTQRAQHNKRRTLPLASSCIDAALPFTVAANPANMLLLGGLRLLGTISIPRPRLRRPRPSLPTSLYLRNSCTNAVRLYICTTKHASCARCLIGTDCSYICSIGAAALRSHYLLPALIVESLLMFARVVGGDCD